MKQPELGLKILELRKAKGLTQEELVERCNINVRTIQRIEAGEVLPRSFTIRSILDALGSDYEFLKTDSTEDHQRAIDQVAIYIKTAFWIGIIYFLLAFVESVMDYIIWENRGEAYRISNVVFIGTKISVLITFIVFNLGFYKLAVAVSNPLLKGASILMMLGIVISTIGDITCLYVDLDVALLLQVTKSVLYGGLYIVFGAGILMCRKLYGNIALIGGILGVMTGLCFITVIFAIPGLVFLTLLEIVLLAFLLMSLKPNQSVD